MKTFVKYAAVALGGYLVGFYEMKYKTMKIFFENAVNKEKEEVKEES